MGNAQKSSVGNSAGNSAGKLSQEFMDLQAADAQALTEKNNAGVQGFLEPYAYFDADSICSDLHISGELTNSAEALIREHRYSEFEVTTGNLNGDSDGLPVGQASMNTDRGGYTLVRFDRRKLIYDTCTDWRCRKTPDPDSYLGHTICEHEAALLIMLKKQLKEVNPGDATNRSGRLLMQYTESMKTQTGAEAGAAPQTLLLEPSLILDENDILHAGFRIGARRMYKIKDLQAYVRAAEKDGAISVGSDSSLPAGRGMLRQEDQGYLDLIISVLHEEECRAEYLKPKDMQFGRTAYGAETDLRRVRIKDTMPLFGERLDRFFTLSRGRRLEIRRIPAQENADPDRRPHKQTVTVQEESARLSLKLSAQRDPADGTFQGICLEGRVPIMLRGGRYIYLLDEHTFCRTGAEQMQPLSLLEKISEHGTLHVLIGRSRLNEFYRHQLPAFRRVFRVETSPEEQALIDTYLPPEPELICYLDLQDGNMICTPQAVYGSHIHNMLNRVNPDEPGAQSTYRDEAREGELLELLRRYFPQEDSVLGVLYEKADDEPLFRLLSEGLEQMLAQCEVRSTQRFRRLGIRQKIGFRAGVSIESGLLDLEITSSELSGEEMMEVLEGYRRKQHFVRLRNGDFLRLDENEAVIQLGELMDSLHLTPGDFVKGKMHIPSFRALYLDRMLAASDGIRAERSRNFKTLVRSFKTISESGYEVPAQLAAVLRPYQAEGHRWLRTLDENGFGGILADEMGLGKTLQVISVLLAASLEEPEHAPSLIVCPASLVYNWKEELRRFAPSLKTMMLIGTQEERSRLIEVADRADVVITSYDLLKRDINQFENRTFRFEIIDEAQYIKNHSTAAAKAVKLIRAKTRYALTGTPIENRLSELWSIFDYLMPGFLYEYASFSRQFERPIVKNHDEQALKRLRQMTAPFILRRLKTDVLQDLPEKLEEVRYAGMQNDQQKLYDAHVFSIRRELEKARPEEVRQNQIQILSELMQLRQICCDPSLLYENYEGESAKREACMDLIRGAIDGGHRILLFSQFTQMLELLQSDLEKAGIPYYVLTGKTDKKRRLELVNRFNAGEIPVFLISLKAGGTGLNLTGADTVIHYDPWWNAAAENQAADRAHRIGQTRPVTIYKMIMKGTIEEKILELQEAKSSLAEDILSAEGTGSSILSRDMLLQILAP